MTSTFRIIVTQLTLQFKQGRAFVSRTTKRILPDRGNYAILLAWETMEPKAAGPLNGGRKSPPDERKEGDTYVCDILGFD